MKSVQNTGKRSFMPVVSVQPDSLPKAGWMKTVSANKVIITGKDDSDNSFLKK